MEKINSENEYEHKLSVYLNYYSKKIEKSGVEFTSEELNILDRILKRRFAGGGISGGGWI